MVMCAIVIRAGRDRRGRRFDHFTADILETIVLTNSNKRGTNKYLVASWFATQGQESRE